MGVEPPGKLSFSFFPFSCTFGVLSNHYKQVNNIWFLKEKKIIKKKKEKKRRRNRRLYKIYLKVFLFFYFFSFKNVLIYRKWRRLLVQERHACWRNRTPVDVPVVKIHVRVDYLLFSLSPKIKSEHVRKSYYFLIGQTIQMLCLVLWLLGLQ